MAGVTVNFPLQISGKNSGFDEISTAEIPELVKFNIKNTLLTCPDERTFDEDGFGVCLRKILFEYPQSSLLSSVKSEIERQLGKFVPYVTVESLEISNPQDMVVHIKLRYYINELGVSDVLEIPVSI
jgi:phage baseplate assembly protein W